MSQGASQCAGMFTDRQEPDALAPRCRPLRESVAVIFQTEFNHRSDERKRQRETRRAGMSHHIGDALLCASVNRDFGGVGGFDRKLLNIVRHFNTARHTARLNQIIESLSGSKALPIRWMQIVGDRSHLFESLRSQSLQPGQRLASRLRQNSGAVIEHFQIQFDAGKRLSRASVQVPRDSRSFALQFADDGPARTLGYRVAVL